ncbi:MAG: DUF3239 domain-containing protein [Planctomycetales bacterium]|nr:DUF3239 domain-containing protein [Planctomycetales bacterium]
MPVGLLGKIRDKFIGGNLNPALVVSVNPPLMASLASLGRGSLEEEEMAAVRIDEQPFAEMSGGPYQVGQQSVAVSLYEGDAESPRPHWADFDADPVAIAVPDAITIERTMSWLSLRSWDALRRGLAEIPQPYQPGIYRVGLPRERPRRQLSADEVHAQLVTYFGHCPDLDVHLAPQIHPGIVHMVAAGTGRGLDPAHLLAVVLKRTPPGTVLFLSTGVRYELQRPKDGAPFVGQFLYQDVSCATYFSSGLEICLHTGARLVMPSFQVTDDRGWAMEKFINAIAYLQRN